MKMTPSCVTTLTAGQCVGSLLLDPVPFHCRNISRGAKIVFEELMRHFDWRNPGTKCSSCVIVPGCKKKNKSCSSGG